jgi:3-isopropylmalate dehydrogenase
LKLRQALGLFANIRPIKPYTDLLDLSPLKEKLLMVLILLFSEKISGGSYFSEKDQ